MTGDPAARDVGRLLLAVCGDYIVAQRQLLIAMAASGLSAEKVAGLRAQLDQVEAAVAHARRNLR